MIYYSHSKQIYNTPRESEELNAIQKFFGRHVKIVDPARYQNSDMPFYLSLMDSCDKLVISEFKGYLGKGCYLELNRALLDYKYKIYLLRKTKCFGYRFYQVRDIYISDPYNWVLYAKLTRGQRYVTPQKLKGGL